MTYTTKTTWLGKEYGCRIFYEGKLVVEGRAPCRALIGATFRDLLRTLDKCGGDAFTSAARKRKFKEGNPVASVKHYWGGKQLMNKVYCVFLIDFPEKELFQIFDSKEKAEKWIDDLPSEQKDDSWSYVVEEWEVE